MKKFQCALENGKKISVFITFLTLSILLFQTPTSSAADICKEGLKELQSSQGVIQAKGGLWGYLEKSSAMKDNSILGLQVDGKLQRLIVSFEGLCKEGKTPTPKLHGMILGLIGDARMIFNKDADRQDKDKVLEKLNNLNKNIGDLQAQLPN